MSFKNPGAISRGLVDMNVQAKKLLSNEWKCVSVLGNQAEKPTQACVCGSLSLWQGDRWRVWIKEGKDFFCWGETKVKLNATVFKEEVPELLADGPQRDERRNGMPVRTLTHCFRLHHQRGVVGSDFISTLQALPNSCPQSTSLCLLFGWVVDKLKARRSLGHVIRAVSLLLAAACLTGINSHFTRSLKRLQTGEIITALNQRLKPVTVGALQKQSKNVNALLLTVLVVPPCQVVKLVFSPFSW